MGRRRAYVLLRERVSWRRTNVQYAFNTQEVPQIYCPFWEQVNPTDVVAFSAAVVSDKVSAKRGFSLALLPLRVW